MKECMLSSSRTAPRVDPSDDTESVAHRKWSSLDAKELERLEEFIA